MLYLITIILAITTILTIYYIVSLDGYKITNFVNTINKSYISGIETFSTCDNIFFQKLRDNWTIIRNEYINYNENYKKEVYRSRDIISGHDYIDNGDIPWENIILRCYNKDTVLIKYFPKTYDLIKNNCTFAMFSILSPGKKILPHHGPYNGVLRYHLGLIIPKDANNCFIMINNNKYTWSEGKDILFDDTYTHHVENNTNETRVVLFLDICRPFDNIIIDLMNKLLLYFIRFNTTVDTIVKNTNNYDNDNKKH
jgi:aspartyl/asparaginyl beta-hydroxylase (cupin superfamily)